MLSTRVKHPIKVWVFGFLGMGALALLLTCGSPWAWAKDPSTKRLDSPALEDSVSDAELNEAAESAKAADAAAATKTAKPTDAVQPAAAAKKAADSAKSAVNDGNNEPKKVVSNASKEKKSDQKKTDQKDKATAEKTGAKKADGQTTTQTAGDSLAPGKLQLLRDEVVAGFNKRGIGSNYARFQGYAIGRVNASAGRYTGSELAGNCRLQWYDYMMRHLLETPIIAEQFTRELHNAVLDEHNGLAKTLSIISEKMDLGRHEPRKHAPVKSPAEALEVLKQALTDAQVAYCAALAPLSKSEIRELQTYMVPVFCTQNQIGHTLADRGTGRRLCDLLEKVDRFAFVTAAEALAPLSDTQLLAQLKSLSLKGDVRMAGVTGRVLAKIDTPSGAIVIGDKQPNTYQLDEMRDVAAVIDLGGGDTFLEGTVGLDRPVLVVIDLGGKNTYRGTKPGIQGAAVLGISMLLNVGGDNTYEAYDVAQGSGLGGVGILIDYGPNNRYRGVRRVQGQALGGIGILIGRGGHNDYRAAMWAQGFGNPLGFGLLDDVVGNNHYFCGGMWQDSYPETPGCEGWGQGVGAGLRQVANGGIGVILAGEGENTYEFDYLAHGGGYWCGVGFARDFGGNTKRLITRTAFNGGPRTQPSFQRFGTGWGCHYAVGFCIDDSGDDVYEGAIMGTGMAWDCSMGLLADFGGNDHYEATRGLTQGTGAQMGLGILYDYDGDDVYEGYGQAYASPSMSYHDLSSCGGNFAFVVDYGGSDKYGCGAQNNCYLQRGSSGGFLIDRPRRDEVDATAAKPSASGEPAGS